ncbi:MAG: hypothetical protein HWD61_07210 [Parachlamydiaceae bacterium]|nr:MAG: hypothetical protein HWD61_07190 [Parachlamydiaceae bacterium]QLH35943.1 MAG: hypothetical protein HWD61_07210 [Parachlamydiaceae bacterium]
MAYRLNQTILKKLSPTQEGFTYQELVAHTDREIKFLRDYLKSPKEIKGRTGPAINFGNERAEHFMGISSDQDEQMIRDAVKLECSKIAQKAFCFIEVQTLTRILSPVGTMQINPILFHMAAAYLLEISLIQALQLFTL